VAEIEGSRKLGGSPGESQNLGCSKSREVKSRGARITIGSREWEDCWIRNPITFHVFEVRRLKGVVFDIRSHEVMKC
jgi:hypothetical protein